MARSAWPALAVLAVAGCSRPPDVAPDPGVALARSVRLIRSATPRRPRVLRILFYGQSISTPAWTDRAVALLRSAYPDVRFDARNLAIGGWNAAILERAVARDIDDAYPDLVVLHVYGDHRAYERIVRTIRQRTAAEVILQTDHVTGPVGPACDRGLRLQWTPPPGCTGHVWFRPAGWEDWMSGRWLPHLAREYGLAVEPRRRRWADYLRTRKLTPADLLSDGQHPNARGWGVMAAMFASFLERVVDAPGPPAPDPGRVRLLAPPAPGRDATIRFTGNRIEILADGPLGGRVTARVDGRPPRAIDGCWQTTRVSGLPNVPEWPGLKQVTVAPGTNRPETWTLRIGDLSPDQAHFTFSLRSTRSFLGRGTADATFVSSDGAVTIRPEDWMIAGAKAVRGRSIPDGTTLTFARRFACGDQPPVALGRGQAEQRHVVATGLPDGPHTVSLHLAADAPAAREIRTYDPPLTAEAQ